MLENKEVKTVDRSFIYKLILAGLVQTMLIVVPLLVTNATFKAEVNLKLETAEKERAELKSDMKDMREDLKKIPFPFDEVARKTLEEHGRAIERLDFLRKQDEKEGRLQTTDQKRRQHNGWHKDN